MFTKGHNDINTMLFLTFKFSQDVVCYNMHSAGIFDLQVIVFDTKSTAFNLFCMYV